MIPEGALDGLPTLVGVIALLLIALWAARHRRTYLANQDRMKRLSERLTQEEVARGWAAKP